MCACVHAHYPVDNTKGIMLEVQQFLLLLVICQTCWYRSEVCYICARFTLDCCQKWCTYF